MLKKNSNFKLLTNSEVSELYFDKNTGCVNAVKILGKTSDQIKCDAVVICTGASTARNLSQMLSIRCPVLPLKSYSFDMPTEFVDTALVFEDKNFTVSNITTGLVRVNGFGDFAGFDTSFDKRRIRNLLNIVAKTLDTTEAMKNMNLKPTLTGLSPDDLPLIGQLKEYPNVYLNVGHGTRASTLAFSSG